MKSKSKRLWDEIDKARRDKRPLLSQAAVERMFGVKPTKLIDPRADERPVAVRLNRVLEVVVCATQTPGEAVPIADVEAAFSRGQRGRVAPSLRLLQHQGRVRIVGDSVRLTADFATGKVPKRNVIVTLWDVVDTPAKRVTPAMLSAQDARAAKGAAAWQAMCARYRIVVADSDYTFGCDAGWLRILDAMFRRMVAAGWDRKLNQVKSKWCTLRVYLGGETNAKIRGAISAAEVKCARACECCGRPHKLKTPRGGNAWCAKCEQAS